MQLLSVHSFWDVRWLPPFCHEECMVVESTHTFGECLVVVNPLGGMSSVERECCHCQHFSFWGGLLVMSSVMMQLVAVCG